jgi:hypothetical protein
LNDEIKKISVKSTFGRRRRLMWKEAPPHVEGGVRRYEILLKRVTWSFYDAL